MNTLPHMDTRHHRGHNWRQRLRRSVLAAGVVVLAWPTISLAAHAASGNWGVVAGQDDRFDDAVRSLRKVTQARPDGEHIRLLSSLRQLRDPALEPLFSALTQVPEPSIQVNAILGLAELSEAQRIDVWKLSRISSLRYQAVALLEAFDAQLVGSEELLEILRWPSVNEELSVRVWLILVYLDQSQDTSGLQALLQDAEIPLTRAYVALALMQAGQTEGCEAALKALDDLPGALLDQALREMLGTVNRLRFDACSQWVRSLLDRDNLSPTTSSSGLAALLKIAPSSGEEVWKARYESATGIAQRMHLAVLLLLASDTVSPEVFSAMDDEEFDLLRDISNAGSATARGEEAVEECLVLVEHHNPPTSEWVLNHAKTLAPASAARLYWALIRDTYEGRAALNERLELARQSADELARIDISMLGDLLTEARQQHRRLTIDAILLGAIASQNSASLQLVEGDMDWDSNRARSLAVILKAHHSTALDAEAVEQLSLVFRGAGSIASPGEVQAAWLYLKLTNQHGQALAAVLGDLMLENKR